MRARFIIVGVAITFSFVGIVVWWNGFFERRISDISLISLEPAGPNDGAICGDHCPETMILRFHTNTNLRKLIRETNPDFTILQVTFCPFDDNNEIWISGVFHNGVEVSTSPAKVCLLKNAKPADCMMTDNTPAVRTEVAAIDEKGPFIYDALFEYRSVNEFDESKHTTVERRLPKTVRDLCFKVSAPAEGFAPERFRSNVVRIPAAILANALHKLDENRAALRHT